MRLFALVLVSSCTACSIFGNSPPLDVRYYDVEAPEHRVKTTAATDSHIELALGKIRSSEFLRNRIVYRESDDALREYDTARWTEYPEVYLRRALTSALYDGGPFVEATRGGVPALDVELLAFEELRRGDGTHAGRVQLSYRLHEGEHVLASDTITVERNASNGAMPGVVESLQEALDDATHRLVVAIRTALSQAPPR